MVRAGGHDSALRKSPPGGGKSWGLTLLPLGQLRPRVAPGEGRGGAVGTAGRGEGPLRGRILGYAALSASSSQTNSMQLLAAHNIFCLLDQIC